MPETAAITHQPTALITGAARRIGAAMARHLARKGWRVLAHWQSSAQEVEALRAELGDCVHPIQADLSTREGRLTLLKQTRDCLQDAALELVVHNASRFPHARLEQVDDELVDSLFALHVKTPLLLSRDLAPNLGKANGLVVTMLDAGAALQWPGYLSYALSKQSLAETTIALARELAPSVRVNGIAPGFILPPEAAPDDYRRAEAMRLSEAPGSPVDILRALDYLLEAPFVTGEILTVDGGRRWLRPLASRGAAAPSPA